MANYKRIKGTTGTMQYTCNKRTVLPLPDIAYYTNESTSSIAINALLPINEALLLTKDIEKVSGYSLRLNNGVYSVDFSVVALPSEKGESQVSLYINNSVTNIVSSVSSIEGSKYTLGAKGIIVVVTSSTQIALVNTSNNIHSFHNVNLVVKKIA